VWDVPVRAFHWTLVVLIATSFVTAQIGGNAMQIHELSGFTILTLVLFRLLWGVMGGTHARFHAFVRGPRVVWHYATSLLSGRPGFHPGHNPLGGWMIVAMLASVLLQAGTGLFANDDIITEGPLARHVSKEISDLLSKIHEANSKLLLALIFVHIAAALYYFIARRDNLIASMVTGNKSVPKEEDVPEARGGPVWLAVLLLALCAGVVYALIHYS
jgi:cytochrome b